MMPRMIPQATLTYAGIPAQGAFTVLRSGSCVPDPITANFLLRDNVPPYGDIVIRYGLEAVTLRNCRLKRMQISGGQKGRYRECSFEDRRWEWQLPLMFYRGYRPWNQTLLLMLAQLREFNVDLSMVPNLTTNVFIEADGEPVVQQLEKLLGEAGLMATLDWQDRLRIFKLGVGRGLPRDQRVMDLTQAYEPRIVPQVLQVLSAPIDFSVDLKLEAVAQEDDGRIVKLDDASYNPLGKGVKDGFANVDLSRFGAISESARQLARRSVWKMYRVTVDTGFTGKDFVIKKPKKSPLPDSVFNWIRSISAMLPIGERRWMPDNTAEKGSNVPASVVGFFHDEKNGNQNNDTGFNTDTVIEYDHFSSKPNDKQIPTNICHTGFHIDQEKGLVIFDDPVYLIKRSGVATAAKTRIPAQLILRTSVQLNDDYGAKVRQFFTQPQFHPNVARGVIKTIVANDLIYRCGVGFETIEAEFVEQAQFFAAQETNQYGLGDSASQPSKGFRFDVAVDGQVSSVQLERADNGEATTTIDWQTEMPTERLTYKEKLEKVRDRAQAIRIDKMQRNQDLQNRRQKRKVQ
jgi:hypothetical protein